MNAITRELFYENMYQKEALARVEACTETKKGFEIILDQTIFYPEGGGQYGDQGKLVRISGEEIEISDTFLRDGYIIHQSEKSVSPGEEVKLILDWELRYARMQEHSGEHIVSGLITRDFGYQNVGFHMGNKEITIDYNGFVSEQDLHRIEQECNARIYENLPIHILYPNERELKDMPYRSKKELTGSIRIVEIPGVDLCACCGTHVHATGEIGLIHFTDCIRYKGGIRITLQIGLHALWDYQKKDDTLTALSRKLSVPKEELGKRTEELLQKNEELQEQMFFYQGKYLHSLLESSFDPLLHFCMTKEIEPKLLTMAVDTFAPKTEIFTVVNLHQEKQLCLIASKTRDLQPLCKKLREKGLFKGGGSSLMIRGELIGEEEELRMELNAFIQENTAESPKKHCPSESAQK